jgi:hypothetical protein
VPHGGAPVLGCANGTFLREAKKDYQRCAPSTIISSHPIPPACLYRPHAYVHISFSVVQLRVSAVHRLPALLIAPPPRQCRGAGCHHHHADGAVAPAAALGPTTDTGRNLRAGKIHHIRHMGGDRLLFLVPASWHVVVVRAIFGMPWGVTCATLLRFCARLPLSESLCVVVKRPCEQIRTQHLGMLIFQCLIDWYGSYVS